MSFFEVLHSEEFDDVKLEEKSEKFYDQVKEKVLGEKKVEKMEED